MNMFLKVLILASVGNVYGKASRLSDIKSKISTFYRNNQTAILSSATAALVAVVITGLLYDKDTNSTVKASCIQTNDTNSIVKASCIQTNDTNVIVEECCRQRFHEPHQKIIKIFKDNFNQAEFSIDLEAASNINNLREIYQKIFEDECAQTEVSTDLEAASNINNTQETYKITHNGKLQTSISAKTGTARSSNSNITSNYTIKNDRMAEYICKLTIDGLTIKYKNNIIPEEYDHSLMIGICSEQLVSIISLDTIHALILAILEQGYTYSNVLHNEKPIDVIIHILNNAQLENGIDVLLDRHYAQDLAKRLQTNDTTKTLKISIALDSAR